MRQFLSEPRRADRSTLLSPERSCYTGAMAQAARTMPRGTATYRDLWRTPDDGNRWEIINGRVYVSPAPSVSHQEAVLNLAVILRGFVERKRLGRVFVAPLGVVLGKPSGVQPDIVFVAQQRRSIIQDKGIFGAPDLLVEVLSTFTGSRDRGVKKDLYAISGVRHYWLVDPRKQTLQALRLAGGAYAIGAEVGERGTFRPTLFPGLKLRMRDVFAR
jgi:Uma2 family endonuclease